MEAATKSTECSYGLRFRDVDGSCVRYCKNSAHFIDMDNQCIATCNTATKYVYSLQVMDENQNPKTVQSCVDECPSFYDLSKTCIEDCNPGNDSVTGLKLDFKNGDNMIDFIALFYPNKTLCHHKCYRYTVASGKLPSGQTP